ncbi:MAG: hypothetical protein IPN76_31750 [Saprospiraceae bacterium]|nr:hypothetical protein [Saprospiraceae bacterium]
MRSTDNQFEDYYYGGWHEVLPNSPGFNYRGQRWDNTARFRLTPWKHAIIRNTPEKVSSSSGLRPLRIPILIEKR